MMKSAEIGGGAGVEMCAEQLQNGALLFGEGGDGARDDNNKQRSSPDPDTIKMFVGQIPKAWNEDKLTEYFEEFGPVYQLSVLRDKETGASRGCCFVTFYHRRDSINAQNALHNIRTFPELNHPIQMKPADVENKNERKLFVGMLAKSMDEGEVREFFKEFGQIEDCTILRENGKSKGCAFLTFVSRSCAFQAIRKMNHSQIFEGCSKPLVVKFADSGKERSAGGGGKKPNEAKSEEMCSKNSNNNMGGTAAGGTINHQIGQQQQQNGIETLTNLVTLLQQPSILPLLETARILQQLQQQQQQSIPQNAFGTTTTTQNNGIQNSDSLTHSTLMPLLMKQEQFHQQCSSQIQSKLQQPNFINLPHGWLLQQSIIGAQQPFGAIPFSTTAAAVPVSNLCSPQSAAASLLTMSMNSSSLPAAFDHSQQTSPSQTVPLLQFAPPFAVADTACHHQPQQQANNSEKYHRGPDGCNLFIYHLPQDFTDPDLYSLFSHFGTILSAKVFVDKQTNLSKCFGFVSYADESSAQGAISGMNGFQIGNKRLKVQLKRSDAKPYEKPDK